MFLFSKKGLLVRDDDDMTRKIKYADDCSADNNQVIDRPVLGYGRSQRRYEMWQNPWPGCSLHIPLNDYL